MKNFFFYFFCIETLFSDGRFPNSIMKKTDQSHTPTAHQYTTIFPLENPSLDKRLEQIFREINPDIDVMRVEGHAGNNPEQRIREYFTHIHAQEMISEAMSFLTGHRTMVRYLVDLPSGLIPAINLTIEQHLGTYDAILQSLPRQEQGLHIELHGLRQR